jgi:hypothetical protein
LRIHVLQCSSGRQLLQSSYCWCHSAPALPPLLQLLAASSIRILRWQLLQHQLSILQTRHMHLLLLMMVLLVSA